MMGNLFGIGPDTIEALKTGIANLKASVDVLHVDIGKLVPALKDFTAAATRLADQMEMWNGRVETARRGQPPR